MEEDKKKQRRRYKFSPDEDNILKKLVQQYGEGAWNKVASKMPGRNVRQCRERWKHYLSSEITKKLPFTEEEDRIIMQKYMELGPKWTKIARCVENRSDIQVKTRILKNISSFKNLIQTQPQLVTQPPVAIQQPPPVEKIQKDNKVQPNIKNDAITEINKENSGEKDIIRNVADFIFDDSFDFLNPQTTGNLGDQQNAGNVFYQFEY